MVQRIKHQTNAGGFTLLELIIALSLSSILMLLVWSLFSTYTRMEQRSSKTATELQLVRSLSQQLHSDIAHFATQAVPPNVVPADEVTAGAALLTDADLPQSDNLGSQAALGDSVAAPSEPTQSPGSVSTSGSGSRVNDARRDELLATPREYHASLPEFTYLRGNGTRVEIITRLPYTVDVPSGQQIIGAESRYGTHLVVVYQWHGEKELETLLKADPVLNPSRLTPLQQPVSADPRQQQLPPPVVRPLNPNDNVGLIREAKSWLHAARDRRRDDLKRQFESAGLLVNGELPPHKMLAEPESVDRLANMPSSTEGEIQVPWSPPPEFRHRRDHIPEVTQLQFRYHDGQDWRLEWNDDRKLPAAIEIAFDLDPDAPSQRAKEFENAHQAMAGGASLTEVLPEPVEEDELLSTDTNLDPLANLRLEDPTAILTEYRFVISLATAPQELETDELSEVPTASLSEEAQQ